MSNPLLTCIAAMIVEGNFQISKVSCFTGNPSTMQFVAFSKLVNVIVTKKVVGSITIKKKTAQSVRTNSIIQNNPSTTNTATAVLNVRSANNKQVFQEPHHL